MSYAYDVKNSEILYVTYEFSSNYKFFYKIRRIKFVQKYVVELRNIK